MFNRKTKKIDETRVSELNIEDIINQLRKYNIFSAFTSRKEMEKWIIELNDLEKHNILSLNVAPESIKFDAKLLINRNLLNTLDYNNRIDTLASIKNAEGYYHLFERLLRPEFLNSPKFYQDIETLKKAECAQTPLWIIGESSFINSPYHDEDFELLVTAKDVSDKKFDYVVWDAIATTAENSDSIYSRYHRQDLQTIVKYGATSLQMSNCYPERGINNLAMNPVSLKDNYHLENMEILAKNQEIGSFLYAVMTNQVAIKKSNYRTIIREMIENKKNVHYVFLVCYYAIDERETLIAQNILEHNYFYDIKHDYDIRELLKKVEERISIVDSEYKDVTIYEIEHTESENQENSTESKNLLGRFLKNIKK